MHCLISEKNPDGDQEDGGHPHTDTRVHRALFRKLLAGGAAEIKQHEKYNGKYERASQSAFADNGSQRRTDPSRAGCFRTVGKP